MTIKLTTSPVLGLGSKGDASETLPARLMGWHRLPLGNVTAPLSFPIRSSVAARRRWSHWPRPNRGLLAARQLRLCVDALRELLGESDEKAFGAANVAEPIRLFILNHFADELRATLTQPGESVVDVVHSEHDA